MVEHQPNPPRWADRFLEWYCNPELVEEIQGDLYERFLEYVEEKGPKKARRWYAVNVFLFMNRYTLRRHRSTYSRLNSLDMFKNYLKIGWRNVRKHKWPSLINVLGLALAIGCCMVVYTFIFWTFNTDDFHENRDNIYIMEKVLQGDDELQLRGDSPEPLGPAMAKDLPQVKAMTRFTFSRGIFQYEDQVFSESINFVDPDFVHLFSFPLKWGKAEDFGGTDGIFLTELVSTKFFGAENPLGKQVSIRFNNGEGEIESTFQVKGVFEKLPPTRTFSFNILVPYQHQLTLGKIDFLDWHQAADATFVQLDPAADPAQVEQALTPYLVQYNENNKGWQLGQLNLQPLADISRHAYKWGNSFFHQSHIVAIIMLVVIAVALLLLVCFNYVNTAIATASSRLKEISVRKVMGSQRRQIISQFLVENLLICLVGLIAGILLAEFLFLPWFKRFAGGLEFRLHYLQDYRHGLFFLTLLALLVLGGGGYPAYYISRFPPVEILKDKLRIGSKNRFRKILLGAQLSLTFIAIFSAVAFIKHTKKLKAVDWGYDAEAKIVIRLDEGMSYDRLENELAGLDEIQDISGSIQQLGRGSNGITIKIEGEDLPVEEMVVGPDYLEKMGLTILDGRFSNPDLDTDISQSVMVNAAFRRHFDWDVAVGKLIQVEDQSYTVIGELEDFRYEDFFRPIQPMVIRVGPKSDYRYLTATLAPTAQTQESAKAMEAIWKDLFPDRPFNFFYQTDVMDGYFQGFEQVIKILSAVAFLTIFISTIGLFGLAMLILARKMKEISIRKVLGANIWNVSRLVNKEFFWSVVLACLVGGPLGFIAIKSILTQISPEMSNPGFLPMVVAVIGLLSIALIAVAGHIYNAFVKNPIVYLRDE
ncbi:MAG: ABC transporter permease [Saprospiraceae bacterium]|nr:ABC transporter permease [Saprospiraceae bacterium]